MELLAPVSSFESLQAANQGGADSVYFGAGPLNMRSAASSGIQPGQICEIVSIARDKGIKSYITLNVTIFDDDMKCLLDTLDKAAKYKVDAIIASDIAVMEEARKRQLSVHASTQLNIANYSSVKFYSRWVDAIVLARELDLGQIKAITDKIALEKITGPSGKLLRIENFAHGALCMAVSGRCYMSLHTHNCSANRGQCVQVCRRSYSLTDNDKNDNANLKVQGPYILSPKDLCSLPFLDKLVNAGSSILKIEGRARPPEYVLAVTRVYNHALMAIAEGSYSADLAKKLEESLVKTFNRGFWDGYYLGAKVPELSTAYGSASPYRKRFVGTVSNYYSGPGIASFTTENEGPTEGQDVLIIGPTSGVVELTAKSMLVDDMPSSKPDRGRTVTMPVPCKLRRGDKLYVLEKRD